MAGGILSRGTAAGSAGAWANAALREQCQLLEVAYVVGMSGRDHLQPMAADIACHIFGVDTLGGRDGLAAAPPEPGDGADSLLKKNAWNTKNKGS